MKRALALVFAIACTNEAVVFENKEAPAKEEPAVETPVPPLPAEDPEGPFPIVLLHGMAGFVQTTGPMNMVYFRDVISDLKKVGEEEVFATLTTPFGTSEVRAPKIVEQLDEIRKKTGKAKLNLIGHSQGGLDARVITSPHGLAYPHIASVTTISTAHRGSRIADTILAAPGASFAARIQNVGLGLVQKAFYESQDEAQIQEQLVFLSEKHVVGVFNPKYDDAPKVLYLSWAGRMLDHPGTGACDDGEQPNEPGKLDKGQLGLRGTAKLLAEGANVANDGMVTVASSKWGKFQGCVAADHMKEVGHPNDSFDHLAFFRTVVQRIRKAGL